jgi:hypothetical protein
MSERDLTLVAGDGVTINTTTPRSIIITASASGAMAPTLIPVGETFTVPANKQALFKVLIRVLGDLVIRGDLLQVR